MGTTPEDGTTLDILDTVKLVLSGLSHKWMNGQVSPVTCTRLKFSFYSVGMTEVNLDEYTVLEQIQTLLYTVPLNTPFRLTLDFLSGKPYKTVFKLIKEPINDTTFVIRLMNRCIIISHKYTQIDNKPVGKFTSLIKSDSATRKCFHPLLKSNNASVPEPLRRTSTDILQVLATKLRHCFPDFQQAMLIDTAEVPGAEGTSLSKYRVLRGGNALYEKYGYASSRLNELRGLLRTLTWSDIEMESMPTEFDYIMDGPSKLSDYFAEVLALNPEKDELVVNIMKSIPMDIDIEHQISEKVFAIVAQKAGASIQNLRPRYGGIMTFTLQPASPAWQTWKNKLILTGVSSEPMEADEAMLEGGRRRKRMRTRKQARKQTRTKRV
jgi:hypothetical protein